MPLNILYADRQLFTVGDLLVLLAPVSHALSTWTVVGCAAHDPAAVL